MKTRLIDDVVDSVFLDCSLSYDGRNTGATTMTLTSIPFDPAVGNSDYFPINAMGLIIPRYPSAPPLPTGDPAWTFDEPLKLTASTAQFTASDVGNAVHLTGSDGTIIRAAITTYTSTTVVIVYPNKTVPAVMRNTAMTTWAKAVDEVGGLWHLEGKQVGVFADGFVVANPNNASYETLTVANGAITLAEPYTVIHVGLPFTSDLETLNIDSDSGQSFADKQKQVSRLTIFVEKSRGLFAGPDSSHLTEYKAASNKTPDLPVALTTGLISMNIKAEWNSSGSVFIRQTDPLPLSILSIIPSGFIPQNLTTRR